MFLLVLGILSFLVFSVFVPLYLRYAYHSDKKSADKKLTKILSAIMGVVICAILITISFMVSVGPNQIIRVHDLNGNVTEFKEGYQRIAPWNKIYSWSLLPSSMTFTESDAADDAFGAQTSDKDYLTAIASVLVAIDNEKMNEYSTTYGTTPINDKLIYTQVKKELKRAFDTTVGTLSTDYVMKNKSTVCANSRELALTYLSEYPFKVMQLTYEDIEASEEYEKAIKQQALLRMEADAATLQKTANEQRALASKVEAEGIAAVKQIEAKNAAEIKLIEANNAAEAAKIAASADAEVVEIAAAAKANATVLQGEADAKSATLLGEAYKNNPALLELKAVEVQQKLASVWNGVIPVSFGGTGVTLTNLTDIVNSLFKGTVENSN